MAQRHADADTYRQNARAILTALHVQHAQDFHTLSSSQVEELLRFADVAKYRQPPNANGSRARYFYARLQRLAKGEQL